MLFELLHWHYRSWHVVQLLDEDPSHMPASSRRVAERSGIELIWPPKRAPKLNSLDHLWGHAKDVISANRWYESIDAHVGRFVRYLRSLPSHELLKKAGVHSGDFWLKSVL